MEAATKEWHYVPPEARPKLLSSEELKNKMYLHFSNYGILDDLHTHLRQRIASEMFRNPLHASSVPNLNQHVTALQPVQQDDDVKFQIANWLVIDHLQRCNFPCTLSTFLTESGPQNSADSCHLNIEDLLLCMSVHPESAQYKILKKEYLNKGSKSFIFNVIHHMINSISDGSAGAQKNVFSSPSHVVENLISMDDIFVERYEDFLRKEHALLEQLKQEYSTKEKLFLEHEQQLRDEVKRERELCNQEMNSQRQALLQEIDSLKAWKDNVQKQFEKKKNQLQLEEEKLEHWKEKLKQKEENLRNDERNLELLLEERIASAKMDYTEQIRLKMNEIERLKNELNGEQEKCYAEKERADDLYRDMLELKDLVMKMKRAHEELEKKYSEVVQQNVTLLNELDQKSDYTVLKLETQKLSKENDLLKKHLIDLEKELHGEKDKNQKLAKELALQMDKPSVEILRLQRELQKSKELQKLNEATWNETRKKLQKELDAAKEQYKNQSLSNDEQRKQIQNMSLSIEELRSQFNRLVKEIQDTMVVAAKPQETNAFSTATVVENERLGQQNKQAERIISPSDKALLAKQEVGSLDPLPPLRYHKSEPLNFISYAKERITQLQLEADALGKKYKGFLETQANAASLLHSSSLAQQPSLTQFGPTVPSVEASPSSSAPSPSSSSSSLTAAASFLKKDGSHHSGDDSYIPSPEQSQKGDFNKPRLRRSTSSISYTQFAERDSGTYLTAASSKVEAKGAEVRGASVAAEKSEKREAVPSDNKSDKPVDPSHVDTAKSKAKTGAGTEQQDKQAVNKSLEKKEPPAGALVVKDEVAKDSAAAKADQSKQRQSAIQINLDEAWKSQQSAINRGFYRRSSSTIYSVTGHRSILPQGNNVGAKTEPVRKTSATKVQAANAPGHGKGQEELKDAPVSKDKSDEPVSKPGQLQQQQAASKGQQDGGKEKVAAASTVTEWGSAPALLGKSQVHTESGVSAGKASDSDESEKTNKSDASDLNLSVGSIGAIDANDDDW